METYTNHERTRIFYNQLVWKLYNKKVIRLGFTGHRDINFDIEEILFLADLFANNKRQAVEWITGGAHGFDNMVEQVAGLRHIANRIIRPDYTAFSPKVAPLIRNKAIVDISDGLVACYDGRPTGGTFFTIRYARENRRPILRWKP